MGTLANGFVCKLCRHSEFQELPKGTGWPCLANVDSSIRDMHIHGSVSCVDFTGYAKLSFQIIRRIWIGRRISQSARGGISRTGIEQSDSCPVLIPGDPGGGEEPSMDGRSLDAGAMLSVAVAAYPGGAANIVELR